MKEILESKVMVLFALFVIGFCYYGGIYTKKLDTFPRESEAKIVETFYK